MVYAFLEKLLVAARLPRDDPRAVVLAGRALLPDAFELLQQPPLSLHPYLAIRVIHESNLRRTKYPIEELFAIEMAFGDLLESMPPEASKLARFLTRAGSVSNSHTRAASLLSLWHKDTQTILSLARNCNPPCQSLDQVFKQLAITA